MKFMKISLLLMISFVNSIAYGILWPFITINIYMLGGSIFSIVFVQTIPYIGYILSRLWGAISDYYGKRKVFIASGYLLSVVPLFIAGWTKELNTLILLIFLANLLNSISFPSFLAALGEEGGSSAYGYSQLTGNTGWAIGAIIVGTLYTIYGQAGVYFLAATTLLLSILMFIILYRENSTSKKSSSPMSKIKNPFSLEFKAKPGFKTFLFAIFLAWTGIYWNSELLKIKLFILLKGSVEEYSKVFGFGVGLLAILSSYFATKIVHKYGVQNPLRLSLLSYAILSILFSIINDPLPYIILYITPIWPIFWTCQTAAAYNFSEKGFEAENMGAYVVATSLAVLLAVLGGLIAELFDVNISIALSTVFFLISLITLFKIWQG